MMTQLGRMHAESFAEDPRHLLFTLARYHVVARLLQGSEHVLEVGCGDGTGAQLVKPAVRHLYGLDRAEQPDYPGCFARADILADDKLVLLAWRDMDAVFALDVLEHIGREREDHALSNMRAFLHAHGTCIIGMPSRESQPYASAISRAHHVNCKTEDELRATMTRHFRNVFLFGMNDAALHVGFGPMCHYRLAVCTGPR